MRVARPAGFGKSECSTGHSIPSEPHRLVLAHARKPEHLRSTLRISVQGGLNLIRLFALRAGRLFVGISFVILVTSLSGSTLLSAAIPVAAVHKDPSCTVTPSAAVLDQLFTVSAIGLPSGGSVNLILTFPNPTAATSPI